MSEDIYSTLLPRLNESRWEYPYVDRPISDVAWRTTSFLIFVAVVGALANLGMFGLSTATTYGRKQLQNNAHYVLQLTSNVADFFTSLVLLAGFVKLEIHRAWTSVPLCWTLSYLLSQS